MTKSNPLSIARQLLADTIAKSEPRPPWPMNVSPWVAMSALQKGIRRGNEDLALHAAATLLENSPERLWRRSGCIAFEDVGLADLETLSIVTAALAGKRFRATLGGDWVVASCIVSAMARAPKCRAADDLLMTAELHPAFEGQRRAFANKSTTELLEIAAGSRPLPERALALWYALGTDRRPPRHLHPRRGDPKTVFDTLRQISEPRLVELSRAAFCKVGEVLCPFVSLLYPARQGEAASIEDDPLPAETLIGDVPSWAYDMYSREGRAALQAFLNGTSRTARWVHAHIPPSQQVNFLGGIVFRVEGGLVRRRLRWPVADELRGLVDFQCHGPHCRDAMEVLELMRSDIHLLNEVRSDVC